MVALSRNIPRKRAFEMLTTRRFPSRPTAPAELGLINRVAPETELENEVNALAERLADKLGSAVKIGKEAFYQQLQMPTDQAYAYTAEVMAQNMLHRDTEEGINAFIEKRPPNWDQ